MFCNHVHSSSKSQGPLLRRKIKGSTRGRSKTLSSKDPNPRTPISVFPLSSIHPSSLPSLTSSNPSAESKFFSIFFTLSLSFVTAPAKSLSVTFPSHAMFTQPLTLPVSLFCHYSALSQDLLSSLSLSLSLSLSVGLSSLVESLRWFHSFHHHPPNTLSRSLALSLSSSATDTLPWNPKIGVQDPKPRRHNTDNPPKCKGCCSSVLGGY